MLVPLPLLCGIFGLDAVNIPPAAGQVRLSAASVVELGGVTLHSDFVPATAAYIGVSLAASTGTIVSTCSVYTGALSSDDSFNTMSCVFDAVPSDQNTRVQLRVWDVRNLLVGFTDVDLLAPSEETCEVFGDAPIYCEAIKACVAYPEYCYEIPDTPVFQAILKPNLKKIQPDLEPDFKNLEPDLKDLPLKAP